MWIRRARRRSQPIFFCPWRGELNSAVRVQNSESLRLPDLASRAQNVASLAWRLKIPRNWGSAKPFERLSALMGIASKGSAKLTNNVEQTRAELMRSVCLRILSIPNICRLKSGTPRQEIRSSRSSGQEFENLGIDTFHSVTICLFKAKDLLVFYPYGFFQRAEDN